MHGLNSNWLFIRDPIVSLVQTPHRPAFFGAELVGETKIYREGSLKQNNRDNVALCETVYHLPGFGDPFFVIFVET